jgi:mono/diheme cytochrome c family protein
MGPRGFTAVSLAVTATLLASCGAGGGQDPPSSGRLVFARSCSSCHSLSGADDPRRQGGDLLDFGATRAQFLQLAAEMPVRPALREAQLRAVVGYVMGVEADHRR